MAWSSLSRPSRRGMVALRCAILISAVCLAGHFRSADAADSNVKVAAPSDQIFTVIVTRHGVRSISNTPSDYQWPSWTKDPVTKKEDSSLLTKHGYQLMTLMGAFYGERRQGIPVDCDHGVFVYADKDQGHSLQRKRLSKDYARTSRFRSFMRRKCQPAIRSSTAPRGFQDSVALMQGPLLGPSRRSREALPR